MESIITDETLNSPEVDIAYRRVDALLRSFGLQHSAIRATQAQRILTESLVIKFAKGGALEAIAADKVFQEISHGLRRLKEDLAPLEDGLSNEKLLLALYKTDIPKKHPYVLLGHESASSDELQQVHAAYRSQNMPEVRRRSMGAPTIRFETIEEMASQTQAVFERLPLLSRLLPLGLVAVFFFIIYSFAR